MCEGIRRKGAEDRGVGIELASMTDSQLLASHAWVKTAHWAYRVLLGDQAGGQTFTRMYKGQLERLKKRTRTQGEESIDDEHEDDEGDDTDDSEDSDEGKRDGKEVVGKRGGPHSDTGTTTKGETSREGQSEPKSDRPGSSPREIEEGTRASLNELLTEYR